MPLFVNILKNSKPETTQNITRQQRAAVRSLQQDPSITVVPADKGKAVVVMDMAEYREKVHTLLSDENTYTKITDKRRNPTSRFEKDLNKLLSDIKSSSSTRDQNVKQMDPKTHQRLHSTDATPASFYGLPKIHKPGALSIWSKIPKIPVRGLNGKRFFGSPDRKIPRKSGTTGTTLCAVPLFLGIFQSGEPKKRFPFSTEPEFSEFLTKWKSAPGIPLRPITSCINAPTYNVSRHLVSILSPLLEEKYSVTNSVVFAQHVKDKPIAEDEIMVSFDVVALFTSIPVDLALQIVREKLQQDATLTERTDISVTNIMKLLEFVLKNSFFSYEQEHYQQTFGCAMGSPVSAL